MPFSSRSELPADVRERLSEDEQDQFMAVFNQVMADGGSEEEAFAQANGAVKKRQIDDDVFTTATEAMLRAMKLGLDQRIHSRQRESGQAVFMPGASPEEYLAAIGGITEEDETIPGSARLTERERDALRAAMEVLMETMTKRMEGTILKADDEERLVWGWASVVTENGRPVVDRQDDVIAPEMMSKAATAFMEDARVAKAMHEGAGIGQVVHSLPLTKELAKALGIGTTREGWIIAMKIHDDAVWKRVKAGELRAFSIGGRATRHAA